MSTFMHNAMRRTGAVSLRSPHSPDDADLINQVRDGDLHAFGVLYSRHVDSAYNLAGQLAPSSRSAQDNLVAAAFQKILEALNAGDVPDQPFRAQALATLREIAPNVVSDAALITSVREGNLDAYGALYTRHVAAAYNLARQVARSQAEADDLVSEAFAKMLCTLKAGSGPDSAFRAYLLTTLRHTAYDKIRRDKKLELSEDVSTVSGVSAEAVSVPFVDSTLASLERSLAARAFATLPERWQAVLRHTEIEGQTPAQVAQILGLTPNGVSALAHRARERLKQAYLQAYLSGRVDPRCKATTDRLGAWTRHGLSKRATAQVATHLDECEPCQALADELGELSSACA